MAFRFQHTVEPEGKDQLLRKQVQAFALGPAQTGPCMSIEQLDSERVLADARVLAPQGLVSVVGLKPGFRLQSGRPGHAAIVQTASLLPVGEIDVVKLHLCSDSSTPEDCVTIPSSLRVMARKFGENCCHSIRAFELQSQDVVQAPKYEMIVAEVQHDVVIEAAVEIQLQDVGGSFFTAMSDIDSFHFIEVCGTMAPLHT